MRGRFRKRRPSPSMLVAIAALVFAVAGTSVASVATISALNKKEKKQTRNISNSEIKKAAPNLAVKSASTASGPAVWAHVSAGGTLLDGRGLAQGNVSIGGPNVICFSGLNPAPRGAVGTTDYWNATNTFSNHVQIGVATSGGIGGSGCPAGTQVFVKGYNPQTNAVSNTAVWITFFN